MADGGQQNAKKLTEEQLKRLRQYDIEQAIKQAKAKGQGGQNPVKYTKTLLSKPNPVTNILIGGALLGFTVGVYYYTTSAVHGTKGPQQDLEDEVARQIEAKQGQ